MQDGTASALIGNADMHLKNWSLVYPDRRHAALAPAYHFLSTIPCLPDENAALSFSRTKRFDEFSSLNTNVLSRDCILQSPQQYQPSSPAPSFRMTGAGFGDKSNSKPCRATAGSH